MAPSQGDGERWNPDQYLRFAEERTRPSRDLVARIDLSSPARIVDIGCGPGNSTRVLCERWPNARILGLDNSPEMIRKAEADCLAGEWVLADAATWEPGEPCDLVFSNAALQWLPNHERLLPRLFGQVASGGALAVQVPANSDSPIHRAVTMVARRPEWCARLADCAGRLTYHPPSLYYDLLAPLAGRLDLWQTTYYHVLPGPQSMIDWYASTGMRPYLERLADDEREAFQAQVLEISRPHYPVQRDGRVLFPFPRLFYVAYRA
jgi:trans-aconitate 2-methyltransferase